MIQSEISVFVCEVNFINSEYKDVLISALFEAFGYPCIPYFENHPARPRTAYF